MAQKKHRKKHPNKPSKTLNREARLAKARQWLPTYEGGKIVRAYRKRFCVDVNSAVKDLQELGYEFKPGYVDALLQGEARRLEQMRERKEALRDEERYNPDQNDTFFYIAGYTSGGAPYGVMWEEMAQNRVRELRQKLPPIPTLFAELNEKQRNAAVARLTELIGEYFEFAEYLPTDSDKDEILETLCGELPEIVDDGAALPDGYDPLDDFDFDFDDEDGDSEDDDETAFPEFEPYKLIIADDALTAAYDRLVAEYVAELKADGFELPTLIESLTVAETERLTIRQFDDSDFGALFAIMKKPEVMYAWEAGFHKHEVQKWLKNQYTRYQKDGYGYFAVTLKGSDKLIGQAGLMKSEINGEKVTEIGYIFDNKFRGQGYALEAAQACVGLAFGDYGLVKLYATIRPENAASVKLAEKLGMQKVGEYVKTYKDKEMPHVIYILHSINTTNKGD
ncbi:hypothetical protein FACS1894202_03940 [Clostridia bacterium]|nr:hypothetical protein FACS1894202_03940 [Clostridia bacterium]